MRNCSQCCASHLDSLLVDDGNVVRLQGNDSEALVAVAFQRMGTITGETKYTRAATELAGRTISRMRNSLTGLLEIKEWGPNKIVDGADATDTAAILGAGGRADDVHFPAKVWTGIRGMEAGGGLQRPMCARASRWNRWKALTESQEFRHSVSVSSGERTGDTR